MRSYAIGDIHGHLDLLIAAHARIAADRRRTRDHDAPVVHLGDLVDRGPASKGVVEYLRAGIEHGERWHVLKGNHDRMFAGFLDDPATIDAGLRQSLSYLHPNIGGGTTLASYGVANPADRPVQKVHADACAQVPDSHRDFLARCPLYLQLGAVVFVHAGIRPGVALHDQSETDLVWIREPFLSATEDHGFLVVHGHTAIEKPTHYRNRVNIDTRAAYGGPLTAAVIEGRDVFVLTDDGREPLHPPE